MDRPRTTPSMKTIRVWMKISVCMYMYKMMDIGKLNTV
jgi:hypothetical protein